MIANLDLSCLFGVVNVDLLIKRMSILGIRKDLIELRTV
jgi:hypothetical protein